MDEGDEVTSLLLVFLEESNRIKLGTLSSMVKYLLERWLSVIF